MSLCDGMETVGKEKRRELLRSREGRDCKTWSLEYEKGETESVESAGFLSWEPGRVTLLPTETGLCGQGSLERIIEKMRGPQVPE